MGITLLLPDMPEWAFLQASDTLSRSAFLLDQLSDALQVHLSLARRTAPLRPFTRLPAQAAPATTC